MRTPIASSSSPMIVTSAMSGTLDRVNSPSASSVMAISLSTEFFAPGTRTSPRSGALRRTTMRSSRGSRLAGIGAHGRPVWPAGRRDRRHATPQSATGSLGRRCRAPGCSTRVLDAGSADAVAAATPRDDFVAEDEVAPGRFAQRAGPLGDLRAHARARRRRRCARPSATASTSPGSAGCSPSRCAPRCAPPRPPGSPMPWWAPPDRLTPRQARLLGLLAAASLSAAFANTLFTQTVNFAADSFGIDKTGQGVGGVVVRLGVVITVPFAIAADRVGRRRMIVITAWLAPLFCLARRGSRRASGRSSPPRPSAARWAWRWPCSSASPPPRRCRATAGPTRSACWRWPAGSAPASR